MKTFLHYLGQILVFVFGLILWAAITSVAYWPSHWLYVWINPGTGTEKVLWIGICIFGLLPLWGFCFTSGLWVFAVLVTRIIYKHRARMKNVYRLDQSRRKRF